MSTPQAAEDSLTYAQFLAKTVGSFDDVRWGPAYAAGTRVFAKIRGVWRAFLLNDLTAPSNVTVLATTDVTGQAGANGTLVLLSLVPPNPLDQLLCGVYVRLTAATQGSAAPEIDWTSEAGAEGIRYGSVTSPAAGMEGVTQYLRAANSAPVICKIFIPANSIFTYDAGAAILKVN